MMMMMMIMMMMMMMLMLGFRVCAFKSGSYPSLQPWEEHAFGGPGINPCRGVGRGADGLQPGLGNDEFELIGIWVN